MLLLSFYALNILDFIWGTLQFPCSSLCVQDRVYSVKGQEAGIKSDTKKTSEHRGKNYSQEELRVGTLCPEKEQNLRSWRFSKPDGIRPWEMWSCFEVSTPLSRKLDSWPPEVPPNLNFSIILWWSFFMPFSCCKHVLGKNTGFSSFLSCPLRAWLY